MNATEHFYRTPDGLRLFYRDYACASSRLPLICLPGLTRNSRDFEDFAPWAAATRRVVTPDFRGRGYSDYDPQWRRYQPATYVADTLSLLGHCGIEAAVFCGTSLGGLVTMMLARSNPACVAAAILNDIGPEIDPAGLARISQYTGRLPPVADWPAAVGQTREVYGLAWPGLGDRQWDRLARRGYREDASGRPQIDMDPNVGRAIREGGVDLGDPWALFDALADKPTLLLRGVTSDILARTTVDAMQARKPDLIVAEIGDRGHVPLLDEPDSLAAIRRFLDEVP